MARLNGWKARLRQLDSSRFQLTYIFVAYYAVWIAPGRISMGDTSLSRLGRVISVYSVRTHSTILVYASTLLCKFDCVWKLTRRIHGPTNWQFITNDSLSSGRFIVRMGISGGL